MSIPKSTPDAKKKWKTRKSESDTVEVNIVLTGITGLKIHEVKNRTHLEIHDELLEACDERRELTRDFINSVEIHGH